METPRRRASIFQRISRQGREVDSARISANRSAAFRRCGDRVEHVYRRNGGRRKTVDRVKPNHRGFRSSRWAVDQPWLAFGRRKVIPILFVVSLRGGLVRRGVGVDQFYMLVKLHLQRPLVLLAVRTVT